MTIKDLNNFCKSTMIDHLGIEFTHFEEGKITATMPVDSRTVQPMRILHGGAIMALAETVGSTGSFTLIDAEKYYAVGMEINGNHVRSAKSGIVTAVATVIHKGKRSHVWDVKVRDEAGNLLSICRITNMVVEIIKED